MRELGFAQSCMQSVPSVPGKRRLRDSLRDTRED